MRSRDLALDHDDWTRNHEGNHEEKSQIDVMVKMSKLNYDLHSEIDIMVKMSILNYDLHSEVLRPVVDDELSVGVSGVDMYPGCRVVEPGDTGDKNVLLLVYTSVVVESLPA